MKAPKKTSSWDGETEASPGNPKLSFTKVLGSVTGRGRMVLHLCMVSHRPKIPCTPHEGMHSAVRLPDEIQEAWLSLNFT